MDSKELLEKILDEWHMALYGDLEHGVAWLNEKASNEFADKYPNLNEFGEWLNDLENEINRWQDETDRSGNKKISRPKT